MAGINGASSSSSGGGGMLSTLGEAMRAPSTTTPDVIVLDEMPEGVMRKEVLDPKEDLWLSTADGRYNAPIIPLRVGEYPHIQTFYAHKDILLKAEYFRKALCGEFREGASQAIDLPEEDPAIFHFLIAFLYEERYVPIRPAAAVLVPDLDKGKGRDVGSVRADSDSDSSASILSDSTDARSLRRRRRRESRHFERMRQKHPGVHRPNCNCPQCLSAGGPPCWHCAAPRVPPPPGPAGPPPGAITVVDVDPRSRRARHHIHQQPNNDRHYNPYTHPPPRNGLGRPGTPPSPPAPPPDPNGGDRIRGEEDLRTWLLAYELNLDVYICANKFLMDDFKREIARASVDMLETAGSDAARPEVLRLCRKLYDGLGESDPLLRMIYARVGFLQPVLWRRAPEETSDFLTNNPEVGALILREMATRREEDFNGRNLPSMERLRFPQAFSDPHYLPRVHGRPPRW